MDSDSRNCKSGIPCAHCCAPVAHDHYLAEDLIACCAQTASGYRWFDEMALARLRFIRAGRAAGFGIKDLKPLLQALDRQDAADIAHRLADLKVAVDEAVKRLGEFEHIAEQLVEARPALTLRNRRSP